MKYISTISLILMILSWNSGLSQDTQISLETRIAKLVVTDLIEGDSAKEQLLIIAKEAELLETKIEVKDGIIAKQKQVIANYEEIVGKKDLQLVTSKELSEKLQKDLKKQKAITRLFKIGSGAFLIAGGVLLIK